MIAPEIDEQAESLVRALNRAVLLHGELLVPDEASVERDPILKHIALHLPVRVTALLPPGTAALSARGQRGSVFYDVVKTYGLLNILCLIRFEVLGAPPSNTNRR